MDACPGDLAPAERLEVRRASMSMPAVLHARMLTGGGHRGSLGNGPGEPRLRSHHMNRRHVVAHNDPAVIGNHLTAARLWPPAHIDNLVQQAARPLELLPPCWSTGISARARWFAA